MKHFYTAVLLITCAAPAGLFAQCTYFTKLVTSASSVNSLGIKSDGTLWSWGQNQGGQLGNGNTTNTSAPAQVGTATNWVSVASGNDFSLGVTADGKLWGWGNNINGALGDGTNVSSLVPKQIGTATNWVYVNACLHHGFAIDADGRLWAAGFGILGTPAGSPSNLFSLVNADNDWETVSTGNYHTIAIKKNGTLWGWGRNGEGEAGTGSANLGIVNTPTQIGTDNDWKIIGAGYEHTLAIKNNGSLWAWGQNLEGEVGDSTMVNRINGPEQIGTATNWATVAAGYTHSLAVTTDGKLWAWGEDHIGELGNGSSSAVDILTPKLIANNSNWSSINAGEEFSLGNTSDGISWAWGRNIEGELGDGSFVNRYLPQNIGPAPVYSALAATGSSNTLYQYTTDFYATDCANLIAKLEQTGPSPISRIVTAKVWVDATVQTDGNNKPYLQRHYQITPASNAATATGTVTLYFTQAEFTSYNAQTNVAGRIFPMLPIDATDAARFKSNLSFTKISGISSDGSGSLSSYTGTKTLVQPTTVIYQNGRWEASFFTTGFSGFFATTGLGVLPVTWLQLTAGITGNRAQLNWKVQEQDVVSYTVEKSDNGINFSTLGVLAGKGDGINNYQFIETQALTGKGFYRIKQTEKDNKLSYSKTLLLNGTLNSSALSLYPNPVGSNVFIKGLEPNKTYHVSVSDVSGKVIIVKDMVATRNELFIGGAGKGIYLVKITAEGSSLTLKLVKQ